MSMKFLCLGFFSVFSPTMNFFEVRNDVVTLGMLANGVNFVGLCTVLLLRNASSAACLRHFDNIRERRSFEFVT